MLLESFNFLVLITRSKARRRCLEPEESRVFKRELVRPLLDGFHLSVRSVPGLGQPWLPDYQKVFLLSLSPQRKFPREAFRIRGR